MNPFTHCTEPQRAGRGGYIGGIFTVAAQRVGPQDTIYFVSFAAGVLVSASFMHIIPKSFAMNSNAPTCLLAGFLGMHLFNRFITAFICERNPDAQYRIGLVPLLGKGFHFFIDGFVYSMPLPSAFSPVAGHGGCAP